MACEREREAEQLPRAKACLFSFSRYVCSRPSKETSGARGASGNNAANEVLPPGKEKTTLNISSARVDSARGSVP
jgi:hypothetical protein